MVLIGGPAAGMTYSIKGGHWPTYLAADGRRPLPIEQGDRIVRGRKPRADVRIRDCYVYTKYPDGSRAYIYRVARSSAIVEV